MMMSNDVRFIKKIMGNTLGEFYYSNYDTRVVKHGTLKNFNLYGWGTMIDYSGDEIHISEGYFVDDVLSALPPASRQDTYSGHRPDGHRPGKEYKIIKSQTPYYHYRSEGGVGGYYGHGIMYIYKPSADGLKEIKNKDVYLHIITRDTLIRYGEPLRKIICDVKVIDQLPVYTLQEMYERHVSYASLDAMLRP